MEKSYFSRTPRVSVQRNVNPTSMEGGKLRKVIKVLALKIFPLLAGIFLILSAAGVLPHPLNVANSWGSWGFVAGSGGIALSLLTWICCSAKERETHVQETAHVPRRSFQQTEQNENEEEITSVKKHSPEKKELPPIIDTTSLENQLEKYRELGTVISTLIKSLLGPKEALLQQDSRREKFIRIVTKERGEPVFIPTYNISLGTWGIDEQKLNHVISSQYPDYKFLTLDEIIQRAEQRVASAKNKDIEFRKQFNITDVATLKATFPSYFVGQVNESQACWNLGRALQKKLLPQQAWICPLNSPVVFTKEKKQPLGYGTKFTFDQDIIDLLEKNYSGFKYLSLEEIKKLCPNKIDNQETILPSLTPSKDALTSSTSSLSTSPKTEQPSKNANL